ncbi:AmmeMemoRadiSam system protein B [Prevotella sp. KH2C16]|uniref:AmmeMemoRadiSam system protein B n=1 Tax=Prevotella sp. KH2C16 TaxID=1855325 RepID=UPI000B8666A6|nr:AmmeMemoRadiSam system protein B [Prevotella sp. KH2C16]
MKRFVTMEKVIECRQARLSVLALLLILTVGNMDARIRKPAVAGQFYEANAAQLHKDLQTYFGKYAAVKGSRTIQAVIVPHAGYVFSAGVAASAFARIAPDADYEHIFLLGPSHHVYLDKASVAGGYDYYATPLGNLKVDTALCARLIEGCEAFCFDERAHRQEHSLEVQLPFLQYRLKRVPPIVPIVVATQSHERLRQIAKALKPYLNARNLFVVSSDFSHYPSYQDAKRVDALTADAILTGRTQDFIGQLAANERLGIDSLATSACGEAAIATLLMMTEGDDAIRIRHLEYRNSGDSPYGGRHRVVGYHSFAFSREAGFRLTDEDKAELKKIARESILATFTGKRYQPHGLSQTLRQRCGAFVSLHKHGLLRGCIGHFGEDYPLFEIVEKMAKAAAFEDPRFPKVSRQELPELDIEISVLTPMRRIHDLSEFILGRHGIYIRKGYHSGTYLPQVAEEVNWTKEEFVSHCSHDKAGLGWDGWKTAELYVYEAIVF